MITMDWKCIDCGCSESNFDERLGERVCCDCGLVDLERISSHVEWNFTSGSDKPFEHEAGVVSGINTLTPKKLKSQSTAVNSKTTMNSLQRSFNDVRKLTRIVLASLERNDAPSLLREIDEVSMKLLENHVFSPPDSYEMRATSVVYYVLLQRNIYVPLRAICQEFDVPLHRISKILRKICGFYRNPSVLSKDMTYQQIMTACDSLDNKHQVIHDTLRVYDYIDAIYRDVHQTKTRTFGAACCYIASLLEGHGLTQKEVGTMFNYSDAAIKKTLRIIRDLVNVKKNNEFKLLFVDNFVMGIRKEEQK